MSLPLGTAYINQEFVPIEEAKISILDWGFLRSDATYDVVHVWKGRFFRLDSHIDRFIESASRIHLTLPVDRPGLEKILAECTSRSGHDNAYVEMILTRGVSPAFSRDPRDAENQLICFAIPFGWILPPEDRHRGLAVAISDIQRIPPESVDPRVKNYHWLDFVMGLYDAFARGSTNVILRDGSGNLTEGPGFNVFVVKNKVIATPNRGVLEGITRRSVIELAGELGLTMEQRAVTVDETLGADEIFATSTAGGIMPITKIDNLPVSDGVMGDITKRLLDAYWDRHVDPQFSISVAEILCR
ncbi:MAG: branched-chain amino acid transferase [marine bacterium B5-7]|nr:MAG: branched-chain amino acid transferase [marine bacterium B5-7]